MNRSKILKYLASVTVVLFLAFVAWWALEGAFRQWTLSDTIGKKIETVIQVFFGILSLCTASTLFWWRYSARIIQWAWAFSFVSTAWLSSLVWGPPMPLISLAFAGVSLLLACGVIWMIRKIERLS